MPSFGRAGTRRSLPWRAVTGRRAPADSLTPPPSGVAALFTPRAARRIMAALSRDVSLARPIWQMEIPDWISLDGVVFGVGHTTTFVTPPPSKGAKTRSRVSPAAQPDTM